MGWFRRGRKRRGSGPATAAQAPSGAATAAPAPGRATATAQAPGGAAKAAAGARQASAAGSPDAAGAAFEQEPVAAARASVPDRTLWRDLEGGVYVRLLGPLAFAAGVGALLDYCARSSQWDTATARALVDRAPRAGDALSRLVGKEDRAWTASAEFVGGVIRALPLLPAEEAVPLLVRLAAQKSGLTAESMPMARAAIRALATVSGELVPPALHQLAAEARLAALRKAAYAELKRKLHTLSDAPEWTVSTFGLDDAGKLRIPVGPHHVAVVRVETGGRVNIRYHERTGPEAAPGRPLTGRPTAATVGLDALREVSETASELRTAIRAARTRLSSAQKERREIPVDDWLEHYITHPVTGSLARTLLWQIRAGDKETWRMGLPKQVEGSWGLITADDERIVPGDGDVLRVAAPIQMPAAQARAWTRLLTKAKVVPALKQITSA